MQYKKILNAVYSYLEFCRNGFKEEDVFANKEVFDILCKQLLKECKDNCDANLIFVVDGKVCFEIITLRTSVKFQIELERVNIDLLTQLLFGQIKCSEFLCKNSKLIKGKQQFENFEKVSREAVATWNNFVEKVGYDESDFRVPDEAVVAKDRLKEEHVLWCYNKSCTGKTFLGIYTLTYLNKTKYVYNPCVENTCDISYFKLLLEYGTNCDLLIDDLQCDIESAKIIFDYIIDNKTNIKMRNIHIFIISWLSLAEAREFAKYSENLPNVKTNPQKFVNMIKKEVDDEELLAICDDNIALLSTALRLKKENEDGNTKELFKFFVQTDDKEQLQLIHILAVLGMYEFETPISFIEHFGELNLDYIITAKSVGKSIFFAHRTISNFVVQYIEKEYSNGLYERKEIIKKYINYIDNRKKWKALIHLIGESDKSDVLSVSPIWNLMYEFQKNLKKQTNIDPSWENTPSSMYFVISTAKMLGVVEEYKDVVDVLCSNFVLREKSIVVKYGDLKTTFDFVKIQERMVEEDKKRIPENYEFGRDINLEKIHRNWLFGLMVGVKDVLVKFGYKKLIERIEKELIESQQDDGSWYPKRVPWVTVRILIGLAEAGYTIRDEVVKKGVEYLISIISDGRWEAHTGGWNNEYETSSLCLEALIKYGTDCECDSIYSVVEFLNENSTEWMSEDNEIDGATTACALLKIKGIQNTLLSYINKLAERNIHNIVEKTEELDFNNTQSCKTTQIAYYVIELCWYILEKDISNLLDNFIVRSELEVEGGKMNNKKIFISFSEDSSSHIKRVEKIADYLKEAGYEVLFYKRAPLGTNNMEFMQKIQACDATIVIGTRKYKEKSCEIRSGGVFFETCVLSREFMNSNYEKIIPLAFDEFNESFPEPFAINKGMRVKRVDGKFLKKLSDELKIKF